MLSRSLKNRYAIRTSGEPLGRRGGAGNKGVELCLIKISKFESDTGCAEKEVHHNS